MSKKDEKKQRPFAKKAAALTTIVGAAAFHKLGGSRALAKEAPKAGRFLREVAEDLSDMRLKDFDAENIGKLYKKHISDADSTFKRLKDMNSLPIKVNTSGNNLISSIIAMKELKEDSSIAMKKLFNSEFSDNLSAKLAKKYSIKDKSMREQADQFIRHVVERDDFVNAEVGGQPYDINTDLIKDFIDIEKFGADENRAGFFEDLMAEVRDNKETAFKEYREKHVDGDGNFDFIKNVEKQFTAEKLGERFGTTQDKSFLDKVIKDSEAVSLRTFVENEDKFADQIVSINGKDFELKTILKEALEKDEKLGDVLIDSDNLRFSKVKVPGSTDTVDEFYNLQPLSDFRNEVKRRFAGTLPGKIFKTTDMMNLEDPGTFSLLSKGKASLTLGGLAGEGGMMLKHNYMQINNQYFRIDEKNRLSHVKDLDGYVAINSKHGTIPRALGRMFGTQSERTVNNKILNWLDIGTSGERTIFEELAQSSGKIGDKIRRATGGAKYNIMERAKDVGLANSDEIAYRENLKDVHYIFSHITNAPNMKTITKMQDVVKDETSKEILAALASKDQEEIVSVLSKHADKFRNKDLASLIKSGGSNRQAAERMLSIKSTKLTSSKNVMDYNKLVRREAFKEVLLNESINAETGLKDHSNILLSLRRAGIKGSEYTNAVDLANWAVLQNDGMLFGNDRNTKDLKQIISANNRIATLLTAKRDPERLPHNTEFYEQLQNRIDSIGKNYKELTTKIIDGPKSSEYIKAKEINDTILIQKGYSPKQYALDMLKDMNDFTKMKANSKKFGMQFVAGRNSPEYVTTYTLFPYVFTQRLIEPLDKIGLGASNKSMGSVGDQWAFILGKRVAPTALALTAMSYLNFETKNITGTSITGAMAQGVANVDLGIRKIADATGVGRLLEAERKLNPLTQYWFGDDYQDSKERKDYYENGYDEVRKGRWWSFGSAGEFRGGKISYYQPNFVKRATSDWKDIGLYGSVDEKWKHSWMPTLRHPLAPIRRALDPYWLERKHYYDRPYMETAPLFSAGTPWGAVLNPTLGELIKPVRKMHKDETRRGLVDPRTLIAERNERIKAKAIDKEGGNLISVSQDGVTNMTYTPAALADPNKMVLSFRVGNGDIQSVNYNGIGYEEGLPQASDVKITGGGGTYAGGGSIADGTASVDIGISTGGQYSAINDLESTAIGSIFSNAYHNVYSPVESISIMNQQVKAKAGFRNGSMREKTNLATMPARLASQREITRQDETDLLLTTSKHDFINDTIFSGKQLSGIYGYLADVVGGGSGRKVRRESADKMASFKTGFWDANVGGLGGGVMEIARRFFPHDDHSWTEINPIRNTMPDWMPERFKTGDPYRKVSKGEMRLPGAGYESIHKLRSDEYGKYGALDRMRILGDIAPWSDEYKTWRDIAVKTVTDEAGKKEIQEIKKRVEKQSRSHEFYNYNYLGTPTDIEKHIIDTVDGTTITTTSGKQFNMAGIKLTDGADISRHLQSGMTISAEFLRRDKDSNEKISAAIYVDGNNINQKLLNSGEAREKENGTAMDRKALTGHLGQTYGAAMEAITHAPIPYIHNKLMRIDTPLEAYKNERVYGTPYSTWDHPIKGFIEPAFQKAWARGAVGQGVAIGGWALAEKMWSNPKKIVDTAEYLGFNITETGVNRTASVIMNTLNPGAFAGSMMAAVPTGLMDDNIVKGLFSATTFGSGVEKGIGRNSARLGAVAMLAGYGITRSDKPLESTAIFSAAGVALANQLNHKSFSGKDGAIVGAAVGLTISALRNPRFDKEKMFGEYTPEMTKERWDIDEYYDRLEYVKYMGLYKKAARKARIWEGTNIKKIIQANEYSRSQNEKKIEKINKRLDKISNSNLEDGRKEELINRLNAQLYELNTAEQIIRAGKYTKAAVAYKQAADSTIYGLQEGASSQQVLRAIPKGDKDFFMEFIKEKDEKKRKEILKYVSPYQRRALQIAWGDKNVDKVESNSEYFKNHFLPGVFWAGWKPQVDMENVKIKTIKNEGMLLSDFGIYESQANEPDATFAPSIGGKYNKANSGAIGLQGRLQGALNGAGLLGVKVSVSPSSANGIEVIANIKNAMNITEYKIRDGINKATGTRMFY